jgi:hypothetical protein
VASLVKEATLKLIEILVVNDNSEEWEKETDWEFVSDAVKLREPESETVQEGDAVGGE